MVEIDAAYIEKIQTIQTNWIQLLYCYHYCSTPRSNRHRFGLREEGCGRMLEISWEHFLGAFKSFIPEDAEKHHEELGLVASGYWARLQKNQKTETHAFYPFDEQWLRYLWRSLGDLAKLELSESQMIENREHIGSIPRLNDIEGLMRLLKNYRKKESEADPVWKYVLADSTYDILANPLPEVLETCQRGLKSAREIVSHAEGHGTPFLGNRNRAVEASFIGVDHFGSGKIVLQKDDKDLNDHFRNMLKGYYQCLTDSHPLLARLGEYEVLEYPVVCLKRGEDVMGTSIDALHWLQIRQAMEGGNFLSDPLDPAPMICATGELLPQESGVIFGPVEGLSAKLLTAFLGHPLCRVYLWQTGEEKLIGLREKARKIFHQNFTGEFPPATHLLDLYDRFLKRVKPIPPIDRHPKSSQHEPWSKEFQLKGKIFLDDWLPSTEANILKRIEKTCQSSRMENASATVRLGILEAWCRESKSNFSVIGARKYSLLMDIIRKLQTGQWLPCAEKLRQLELPDLEEYRGNLDGFLSRAFFVKVQLLYKLKQNNALNHLIQPFLQKLEERSSWRPFLYSLRRTITKERNQEKRRNEEDKLTDCLIALNEIKDRLVGENQSVVQAKPFAVILGKEGSIVYQKEKPFRIDTKNYSDFYANLYNNENFWEQRRFSAVMAGLAALAGIFDSIQNRTKNLKSLEECFPQPENQLRNDPFFRHDWLYARRIGETIPSNTPSVPNTIEALRKNLLTNGSDLENSLATYREWYQSILEQLDIQNSEPPFYGWLEKACASQERADLLMADWTLDF